MSEQPPNIENERPKFAVTIAPRIYTKENDNSPKKPLKETDLLESFGHNIKEREDYNSAFNDGLKQAFKINVTTPEDLTDEASATKTSEVQPIPEVEPGTPVKAKWNRLHGDEPLEIEVMGDGDPFPGDGRETYRTKDHGDIPKNEVELEATPPEATEAPLAVEAAALASPEKEAGKENLRREAINPERILELKDQFEREFRQELEGHNIKTAEDRQKDPWLVKSAEDHIKNRILREYLKYAETDWDTEELAEVREDVLNMMSLSQKTLENLMLRPESETSDITESERIVITPPPDETTTDRIVVDLDPDGTVATAEGPVTSAEVSPPSVDDDELTLRQKLKNRFNNAKVAIYGAPIAVLGWLKGEKSKFEDDESLSEEEKQKKRRRRRLAGVAGVLAAFGAGLLLCNVLGDDNGVKEGIAGAPGADGGAGGDAGVGDLRQDGPGSSNDRLPYDGSDGHGYEHGQDHNGDIDHSHDEGDGHHHHDHTHNGEGEAGGGENATPTETLGEEFYVEPGHGITHELQDFSKEQGFGELSGDESFKIYEEAKERFGVDLIDSIDKQADTYIRSQGDVGISNPGRAVWPTEVEQFFRQRLAA